MMSQVPHMLSKEQSVGASKMSKKKKKLKNAVVSLIVLYIILINGAFEMETKFRDAEN